MRDNELDRLRRANPVEAGSVDHLVDAHRAAFAESIGAASAASGGSVDGQPTQLGTSGTTWTRFNMLGAAAATIVILALPVFLLVAPGRDDGSTPDGNLRLLDEVPSSDDSDGADETDGLDDELFTPVPTDRSADPDDADPDAERTPVSDPSQDELPVRPANDSDAAPEQAPDVAPPTTSGAAAPPASPTATTTPSPTVTSPVPATSPDSTVPETATTVPADTDTATTTVATTSAPTNTATTTTTTSVPAPPTPPGRTVDLPFDASADLFVLTFDFANSDDGHAAAAAREIATSLGIEPLVVAASQAPGASGSVPGYAALMSAVWADGWVDASNRPAAVTVAADRWLATIDGGGVVRIAEGGVSDFTADVLREVDRRRPGLVTSSIVQVVQHIQRNEDATRVGDLDFVMARSTYVRIDDGNNLNGTADLFETSSTFEATALAGRHGDAWAAAFEFRPAGDLDFSDTVTALHILGVGLDSVSNPDTFATLFIN